MGIAPSRPSATPVRKSPAVPIPAVHHLQPMGRVTTLPRPTREGLERAPQPLVDAHGRFVSEKLACGGYVRQRIANVTRSRCAVLRRQRRTREIPDVLEELVE